MVGELTGKRVLVTGAAGFIGGRLVERLLLEERAQVRALVRSRASAVWLSRTTAELVPGDITRPESLRPALESCDVVFHCAAVLGGSAEAMRQANVVGTENLLIAARESGVTRFVHMSSVAVHGPNLPNGADESTPPRPGNSPYAQTKLAAERLVHQHHQSAGLPTVTLRPTIVYGPRSQWWTVDPILRIKKNQLALVGQGRGIANVVYVDDVVNALLLAATVPGIEGETFLISNPDRVTWANFFGAYARMVPGKLPRWPTPLALGITALTALLDNAIQRARGASTPVRGLRLGIMLGLRTIRKAAGPLFKLYRTEVAQYLQQGQVSVAKAGRLLGFRCEWPLDRAMAATERWLQAQGYLP